MTAEERIQAFEERVDELKNKLGIVQDELAIRRLQHIYGYLIDKCMHEEAVNLFSDRGETYFLGALSNARKNY